MIDRRDTLTGHRPVVHKSRDAGDVRLLGEELQQGIHTYDVDQARKRTTLCETREEAAPTLLNPLQHQSRLRLEHGHDEVVEEFRQARRAEAPGYPASAEQVVTFPTVQEQEDEGNSRIGGASMLEERVHANVIDEDLPACDERLLRFAELLG